MGQTGWRLPDDLLKRVRVHCAETGERQNEFVRQALESALKVPPLDSLGPSPSPALLKAAAEESMKQRYVEGGFEAAEKKASAPRLGKGFVPPRPKGK